MTLPLDLKVDPRNAGVVSKLAAIEAYDFSEITKSVEIKYAWSREKSLHYEAEVKKFFSLAFLDPGFYHIPEEDVDEYWHRMILHTKFYNEFCANIFGQYYHHTPEPDPNLVNEDNRTRTLKLIPYWFGNEWETLVRTCTQCKGPILAFDLKPHPDVMPKI